MGPGSARTESSTFLAGSGIEFSAVSVPTTQPALAIALVLEVGYNEALKPHHLEIVLRREDGQDVGPRAIATFNVGHPPWLEPGAPVTVPLAFEQQGIVFDSYGRFEWVVYVDGDQELARLPVSVSPMPLQPPFPLTGMKSA